MDLLWFRIKFKVSSICYCTFIRIWSCFSTFFQKIPEKASEIGYTYVILPWIFPRDLSIGWYGSYILLENQVISWITSFGSYPTSCMKLTLFLFESHIQQSFVANLCPTDKKDLSCILWNPIRSPSKCPIIR